jgi:hypothetical protein
MSELIQLPALKVKIAQQMRKLLNSMIARMIKLLLSPNQNLMLQAQRREKGFIE